MEEVKVPSNVLEVDHSRAKYYNEKEEVVSEVVGYQSLWRSRSDLAHLVEQYSIPGHALLMPTGEMEQACLAPRNDWMPNLFSTGPSSTKGWKDKFFFVDDAEWGRSDVEVAKLYRDEEVRDIMYLTSSALLEATEIYGPSSMSEGEMNRLMSGGKTVTLLEKRSKALAAPSVGERVVGGTLRSCPSGGARAEIGLSLEQWRKTAEEVATQKRRRVEEIEPSLHEVGVVTHEKGKESPIPRSTFPKVDLKRARHEVEEHGGSSVVRHALETVNLINALAVEYYNRLKERNNLVEKNEELNQHKQSTEQNFTDLTSECKKVREELASAKASTEAEVEKRKKAGKGLAKAKDELAEAGVEEDRESKTAEFCPDITLSWEWNGAGRTVLPSSLDYEFIAVDED
ncbi:hypothetical protein SLEP1_g24853 [Rubroshorea leprosula]|uniref:Uncharacterized protein n=1 Tax=Rubroshorea leprosula TaxID=152421 RepID=A0AAV5JN71_9ROSI|nr:hypothetical protein SLEP1_g24853 [Rubroshorea leprosula]